MKIHGTAKGGALSTKDFGVAFGGGGAATEEYCQSTGAQDRDLNPATAGYNAIGQIFETNHILMGETVTKVTFSVKAGVASPIGGTYHAAIHSMTKPYADVTDPVERTASDSYLGSELPADFEERTFTFTTPRTMVDGDMISIQGENLTGSGSVLVLLNDDTATMTYGNWARTKNNWANTLNTDETAQMKLCVDYLA